MKFSKIIFVLFLFTLQTIFAQEGMWMPNQLAQNEQDMKDMGMQLSIEDIYNLKDSSIKDAIAIFGRGCTSEIVSDKGLLFTNHHCGFDAIQSLSTMENNYLRDGFWAKSFAEELPKEGLTATIINSITDVTSQVLAGADLQMGMGDRQSFIDKNIQKIQKETQKEAYQTAKVMSFYKGNQFFLIIQTVYRDVRLVGTPPQSIGKFGSDTDNWMWPRHTGDFSIFRIYADENNLPATYSPSNKPYTPKHHLPISIDGIEEGDFTLVYGFPYNTDEYLTSYAVKTKMDVTNPARVKVREAALAVLDKEMRKDEATRLKYASKFAGIANYWKFAIGESKGLRKFNAVAEKEKYQAEFTKRINQNPTFKAKYQNVLPDLKKLYNEVENDKLLLMYNSEIFSRNTEMTMIASILSQLINLKENQGEEAFNMYKGRYASYIEGLYKDYDPKIDQMVFASLMDVYKNNVDEKYISKSILNALKKDNAQNFAKELYSNSILTNGKKTMELINGDYITFEKTLSKDKAYQVAISQQKLIDKEVSATYNKKNAKIEKLMRLYMQGQMDVFTEKKFYPDANASLRVAYGKVRGYSPKDAVYYKPQTYLSGVMEKYKPGDYEFDVPQKLRDLYAAKDYGQYAENGKMPVCYLATNHITGGNSGSPVLDAHGNLIGLAFDGVWEGTMEDVFYKPEVCMSIMVDARYVLFIIEKLGGATNLIDELTIVHPKKK
ncbi:MAG TPA: S46 family peptidase [Lutibacter sp.]|nr:S46 family peptidase [Lutibacter sp.]